MDRISNKINSDSSYINYEHFAKTYLLSAKILLEAKESSVERNATEKMRIDSGLIYIPIIYLIRHSIELILKSVDVGNSKSYLKTHDLENLHKEYMILNPDLTILLDVDFDVALERLRERGEPLEKFERKESYSRCWNRQEKENRDYERATQGIHQSIDEVGLRKRRCR